MKYLLYLLSAVSGLAALPGQLTSPATLSQYKVFTSNDVAALTPKAWYIADIGPLSGGGVPADGAEVDTWNDISGNGYTLINPNAGTKPRYRLNSQNGMPGVDSGPANCIGLSNLNFGPINIPVSVFAVFRTSNGSPGVTGGIVAGGQGVRRLVVTYQAASPTVSCEGHGLRVFTSNTVNQVSAISITNFYFGKTNTYVYLNGKLAGRGTPTAYENNQTNIWLGVRDMGGSTTRLLGCIYEVIVFNSHINDNERRGIELYLKKRWAIQNAF